ncbi:nucleoside phosphorylase domain-containing protein [Dipodascopsis tothii]|uniref:nucleoside phosphorylase domain-containing protein n=1 Tax=Dipodascopsis tothii TaxID=44089 RepID=UPI0034CDE93D
MSLLAKATESVAYIQSRLPAELQKPKVAVICGSGLQNLASALDPSPLVEIPFADIPHFPVTTVVGHAGKLVFGFFGPKKVPALCMVGRIHFYEGNPFDVSVFPIRVFKVLGIDTMVVTNAAGGLNPAYKVGDLMVLSDHINLPGLAGWHPLRGPNEADFGTRFPPLSDAYDLDLRQRFFAAAGALKLARPIHEGVYAFVSGPTYETRAESRMLKMLGADCVGMSTVPEIIIARHSGVRILAVSLVTNEVVTAPTPKVSDGPADIGAGAANHEEVLEAAREAGNDMKDLVLHVVGGL